MDEQVPLWEGICTSECTFSGVGELSVFCQSYFNKTLIGQAGSIGGKARQEVGVEQRDWEYSGSRAPSAIPVQTTEEAACNLPC